MKKLAWMFALGATCLGSAQARPLHMPYEQAGLTKEQAAAHLLSRFTFGARPGEVDAVTREGLDRWFEAQLVGKASDADLEERLADVPPMKLTDLEISETYLNGGQLRKMAMQEGAIEPGKPKDAEAKAEARKGAREFGRKEGLHQERELLRDIYAQKLLRAVYSRNETREVLTDFWFNHFNVSRTNKQALPHILTYERDAIRPNVFGSFRNLLGATAKHPAMLYYLNNAQSIAPEGAPTLAARGRQRQGGKGKKKQSGLNENYARELMELHTLGVDGGYTQHDVEQVARALTGWTSYGRGPQSERFIQRMERQGQRQGIIEQGSFYFIPGNHDAGSKTILGQSFPAGHGLDEGERVLDLLCHQQACARFLAQKLAVRFVGDHPPEALVKRLANRFMNTNGNLTEEYETLVESPEFWAPAARRAKVKSAFEYVVSSIRAIDAELMPARNMVFAPTLTAWLEHMGQPIYGYVAPTGFPDRAEVWINSGTIVNRINFAFALVTNRLPGVRVSQKEPTQKLEVLAQHILPGRDASETIKLVKTTLADPAFFSKINTASAPPMEMEDESAPKVRKKGANTLPIKPAHGAFTEEEKMVGVLLSSPEFQRR